MPIRSTLRSFDLRQLKGHDSLIGVDEAGRGALAGPVVAAAVELRREFLESSWARTRGAKVNDSKQLSPEARAEFSFEILKLVQEQRLRAAHGSASAAEIEELNILGATKLAMRRALEKLYSLDAFVPGQADDLFTSSMPEQPARVILKTRVIIDGLRLKGFPYPHEAFVKGDGRSLCIAMASILAKVERDRLMTGLSTLYPNYGFELHKGYGTEAHRSAVLEHGRCPEHREMFLRKLLSAREDPSQLNWIEESQAGV